MAAEVSWFLSGFQPAMQASAFGVWHSRSTACFLALEAWLPPHWVFIISGRQLWPPSGEPLHQAKMWCLSQNQSQGQSQSPSKPQSSLYALKFFHIIHTMPDNKVAFNTAMLYGLWRVYWNIATPSLYKFLMKRLSISKIFFRQPQFDTTEPDDAPGEE